MEISLSFLDIGRKSSSSSAKRDGDIFLSCGEQKGDQGDWIENVLYGAGGAISEDAFRWRQKSANWEKDSKSEWKVKEKALKAKVNLLTLRIWLLSQYSTLNSTIFLHCRKQFSAKSKLFTYRIEKCSFIVSNGKRQFLGEILPSTAVCSSRRRTLLTKWENNADRLLSCVRM